MGHGGHRGWGNRLWDHVHGTHVRVHVVGWVLVADGRCGSVVAGARATVVTWMAVATARVLAGCCWTNQAKVHEGRAVLRLHLHHPHAQALVDLLEGRTTGEHFVPTLDHQGINA